MLYSDLLPSFPLENTQVVYLHGCFWSFIPANELIAHWQAAFLQNSRRRETTSVTVSPPPTPNTLLKNAPSFQLGFGDEFLKSQIYCGKRRHFNILEVSLGSFCWETSIFERFFFSGTVEELQIQHSIVIAREFCLYSNHKNAMPRHYIQCKNSDVAETEQKS